MNTRTRLLLFWFIILLLIIFGNKWIPWLLNSITTKPDQIQAVESIIQIVLWLVGGLIALFGLRQFIARGHSEEGGTQSNTARADGGGISIIGDNNIAMTGSRSPGAKDDKGDQD